MNQNVFFQILAESQIDSLKSNPKSQILLTLIMYLDLKYTIDDAAGKFIVKGCAIKLSVASEIRV